MPKAAYYDLGGIGDNVIRYDMDKFRSRVTKTGHWGPWDLKTESGL